MKIEPRPVTTLHLLRSGGGIERKVERVARHVETLKNHVIVSVMVNKLPFYLGHVIFSQLRVRICQS